MKVIRNIKGNRSFVVILTSRVAYVMFFGVFSVGRIGKILRICGAYLSIYPWFSDFLGL